ncbi:TauD/TfdA family dioxygenase [Paraliomyxa miuraensis]|uniref:TauD/TfdA family dioxygenase n=1 Tax=Paraliomyxa miuraensis TaxID=376150 RepID=UPI0022513CE1|nr:TauD/TfdA family dioxygenase [Paraliomyxa miuraensis]MCX4247331.1 TauD/TfdA family dioxygenase [Paraliomyxa miuraensis]
MTTRTNDRGRAPGLVPKERRGPTRMSSASLVETSWLPSAQGFPLVVEPRMRSLSAVAWAEQQKCWIEDQLLATGAILFRGFHLPDRHSFRAFASAMDSELLDYVERAAPRAQVAPNVFTSTAFAPDQSIPLHHEMSYSHNWPARLWLYCEIPPDAGGATPIASERQVTKHLEPWIKSAFLDKGISYVRNYGVGVDMTWQEAFQTTDPAEVEHYCRSSATAFEWRDGDRLHTRAIRQVTVTHPRTGEELWFNHAPIFHETNLPPEVHEALRAQFDPEEMPRNAFHADGSPLDPRMLDAIRRTYQRFAVRFAWHKGDVLMLDNFLAVHGRDPFEGPRSILVAMAKLHHNPMIGLEPREPGAR